MEDRLRAWPDEMLWLLGAGRLLHGTAPRLDTMLSRCLRYPHAVANRKLRRAFGGYLLARGGVLAMAARRREPAASLLAVGQIIDCACQPVAELRQLEPALLAALRERGWDDNWLTEPERTITDALKPAEPS